MEKLRIRGDRLLLALDVLHLLADVQPCRISEDGQQIEWDGERYYEPPRGRRFAHHEQAVIRTLVRAAPPLRDWITFVFIGPAPIFRSQMEAFCVILREHTALHEVDFKIGVLAQQLVWPDQAGNFAERRRILGEFLRVFSSGEITEEMLKEPTPAAT